MQAVGAALFRVASGAAERLLNGSEGPLMARVRDILSRKGHSVATIVKERTVLQAATLMNDQRIGAVVVVEGDDPIGIFTERDILTRVVAVGRDPATTEVGEVMTSPITTVHPQTPLDECKAFMSDRRIRHLPVVDGDRLVGIITSGDALAHEVHESRETISNLQSYIYGPTGS